MLNTIKLHGHRSCVPVGRMTRLSLPCNVAEIASSCKALKLSVCQC